MMFASSAARPDVECHPMTPTHWPDLEPIVRPSWNHWWFVASKAVRGKGMALMPSSA